MTKIVKIFLIIVTIIAIPVLLLTLTSFILIKEVKTLDMQLKVDNNIGFNIDTDKIYFGTIPPGNTGARRVNIENMEYKKVISRIKLTGELKDWVTVSHNNFRLEKGESQEVTVDISIPEDAEKKDYEGRFIILFTRF